MWKQKKVILPLVVIMLSLSFLFFYKTVTAIVPPLKEGTYLSGQTLSVWPSWTLLGNALGQALPVDPINQLALGGTCAVTTNRFCTENSQCPNNENCVLHDPNTGWSTTDRRFSFACNRESYAYRYIVLSSTGQYVLRAHLEDPGITPANFSSFVSRFVSTSVVKINEDSGVCNFDQEISTLQSGRCGDGRLNLDRGEQCDPPGRIQYQTGCVGSVKNLSVCNNSCQWTPSTTLCSNLSNCGNGIKESGETCDDGNLNGKYNHCNNTCSGISSLGRCGNGTVESAYEICDPGTPGEERYSLTSRQDSCSWDCQNWGPYCGNSIVEAQYEEECDGSRTCAVGGVSGTRACANNCKQVPFDEVAWLRFDQLSVSAGSGITQDNTTNNNDAICSSSSRCPVRVQGKYGNALAFNGNNNVTFLTVNHSASLNTIEAVTVEAWVNLSSYNSIYQRIVEKGGPSSGQGYGLEVNASSTAHTARFNLWNGTQTAVDSNVAIPTGTWTHIVGTFERAGNNNIAKIYVNGNLENTHASVTTESIMMPSASNIYIGSANGATGNYLLGLIDEIKIYNRALSADAVRDNYQNNWSCNISSTPAPITAPGACGNNVVDANEACDRGVANNGRACTPTYGQSCTYCSSDCQNTIDVQPLQYCGNGIIESTERCDMAGGEIYAAATNTNNTTVSTRDAAHNGYRELACSQEPFAPHTIKKGTKNCGDCSVGVVRDCVTCGVDLGGVTVGGGLVNVLANSTVPAAQRDPLFTNSIGSSSLHLAIGNCYPVGVSPDPAILPPNICTQSPLSSAAPLVGRELKNQNAQNLISYTLQNPYGPGNALVSSNPVCSADADRNKRYLMYINKDWTRPFLFTVVSAPQSWQYDFVLSPIIDNTIRNRDLRVVVSWVGPEDFIGSVFNPFATTVADISGASYCNTVCFQQQKRYATGVQYYTAPNSTWHGVWYHGLNATPGQTNAESFTIHTDEMTGNTYAFYVRSPSVAIRQFKNTARLKVEIYAPEENFDPDLVLSGQEELHNPYRFGTPIKTILFQAAAPSDNPNAKYWQVFNLSKPAAGSPITADNIIEINTIKTGVSNFTYSL